MEGISIKPLPEDPQGELARCLPRGSYAIYVSWIGLRSEREGFSARRSVMLSRCELLISFRLFSRCRDNTSDEILDTLRLLLSGFIPPVLQNHPNYHTQEPGMRHVRGELLGRGEGAWIFEEEYVIPLLWRRGFPVTLPGRPGL